MVEQGTVNPQAVGSSPTLPAKCTLGVMVA